MHGFTLTAITDAEKTKLRHELLTNERTDKRKGSGKIFPVRLPKKLSKSQVPGA